MYQIIQIKCPFCGAVLSVKELPGIERKMVSCPICRQSHTFSEFRRVDQGAVGSSGGGVPEPSRRSPLAETPTEYAAPNFTLGQLRVVGSEEVFQLRPGRNVVGRKCKNGTADFQIDTGSRRAMSRQHLIIDVRKEERKGFVHYVSLCKENVNPTLIDDTKLVYGVDTMILNHGATLHLPDCELKFLIPDEDATEL